jgi:hypothetical protein
VSPLAPRRDALVPAHAIGQPGSAHAIGPTEGSRQRAEPTPASTVKRIDHVVIHVPGEALGRRMAERLPGRLEAVLGPAYNADARALERLVAHAVEEARR